MKFITLEEIDSTNIYAKMHINDLVDKTVIIATHQTQGRGRLNRLWVDLGNGNLFFSVVLKPSSDLKPVYSNLTQYACVCLCKVFERYGISPKIKWPNDIMIEGQRKISGILSETVLEKGLLKGIVLGIGVNLQANNGDIKKIPNKIVTALNLETNKSVNKDEFLTQFIEEFLKNYDNFLEKGFIFIEEEYISRNCFLNKDLKIQVFDEIKTGFASCITHDGALVLKQQDNKNELLLTIGDIL